MYKTLHHFLTAIFRYNIYSGIPPWINIIGPNGSGKTTLLKVIAGVAKPQRGGGQILGHALGNSSRRQLARQVALVPQQPPSDIPFSVAEVLLLGRSPHLGLLALEQRKDFTVAERAMVFAKVDHLAGRKLNRLSAGKRERGVFIARAICRQASIIALDEPTAVLDPAHQTHIMDLMEKLRKEEGITVIMVSHDLNLAAMYGNRLLLMKQGAMVNLGRPEAVLNFETLERTYGCVLLVDRNPLKDVPRVTQVPKEFLHKAHSPEPE